MSNWLNKYFSAVVRYLGVNLPMRGIVEVVGNAVAASDETLEDGTKVTRLTVGLQVPGEAGELMTSDGEGNFGTPVNPNVSTSASGKKVRRLYEARFETVNATQSTAFSFDIPDGGVTTIDLLCTAIQSDLTAAATYKRSISYLRSGGTVTTVDSVRNNGEGETAPGWDCTIDRSGTTARIRVTGALAATIRWDVTVHTQTTVP